MGCKISTTKCMINEPTKKSRIHEKNENKFLIKQKIAAKESRIKGEIRKSDKLGHTLIQNLEQTVAQNANFRSSTLQRLSHIDLSFCEVDTERTLAEQKTKNEQVRHNEREVSLNESKEEYSSDLLFSLNSVNNKLFIIDLQTKDRTYKDLNLSTVHTPAIGKQSTPKNFLKVLGLLTMLALNSKSITFIGTVHFEYDINENCFYKKTSMKSPREGPLLSYSEGKIYAISGSKDAEASTLCEEYDINEDKWTAIESLREPHTKGGSTICKDSNGKALSLVVMGGCQSLEPLIYNPNVSVFEFTIKKWKRIPIEEMTMRVPKFVNIQLVQSEEKKLLVFGTDYQCRYYEMNLNKKVLLVKGNLNIVLPGSNIKKIQTVSCDLGKEVFISLLKQDTEDQQKQPIPKELLIRSKLPFKQWNVVDV